MPLQIHLHTSDQTPQLTEQERKDPELLSKYLLKHSFVHKTDGIYRNIHLNGFSFPIPDERIQGLEGRFMLYADNTADLALLIALNQGPFYIPEAPLTPWRRITRFSTVVELTGTMFEMVRAFDNKDYELSLKPTKLRESYYYSFYRFDISSLKLERREIKLIHPLSP
jgi:hypothetical protein